LLFLSSLLSFLENLSLLTIDLMLSKGHLNLFFLRVVLCLLSNISPTTPASGNHCSVFYEINYFKFHIMSEIVWSLSLCLVYSFNIMSSKFIYIVENKKFPSLYSICWIVLHCIDNMVWHIYSQWILFSLHFLVPCFH
jgi:hypothetical protein